MKQILQFSIFLLVLLFNTSDSYAQCPFVVPGSFMATSTPNGGLCDWSFSFDVDNSSGAGNASLAYTIQYNNGNDLVDLTNPTCVGNIVSPGSNVTNTSSTPPATIPCDAEFELVWTGWTNPSCGGDDCDMGVEPVIGPQPVELVEFTGTPKDNMVELKWSTQSEENNRHFEIQRSEDGRTFENIGMAEGNGTSVQINHYSFIDKQALPFAYYRLKQVDFDGAFDFSDIVSVKNGVTHSKLNVYPTQAFNEITVRIETLDTRKSFLKIANISGQIMHEETYYSSNGAEYLTLDIKDYQPGIYFISLSNNFETITSKFVVVKD